MEEKEYQALIDRATSIAQVQENFSGILGVLRDLVNYGSNLIPRCFVSSKRRLEDAIILGVLLRQAVAMFDAIEILVSNAAVYPCHLQTRAIFEASLYLEWILNADTEKRAKYFYVANVRQERVWAQRTQSGSSENLAYEKIMAPFGDVVPDATKRLGTQGQEYLKEIDRILAQSSFVVIDKDIEAYRAKKKIHYDPPWYAPLGPRSVRQIAEAVKRLHEYELIYSESSEVMHSTSHKHHVRFSQGRIVFTPIRYLAGIDNVIRFSMATMLKIYKDVLKYYRPDETVNFGKKYIEDWQREFIGIRGVEYKDDDSNTTVI
jgi:hypothetical protein